MATYRDHLFGEGLSSGVNFRDVPVTMPTTVVAGDELFVGVACVVGMETLSPPAGWSAGLGGGVLQTYTKDTVDGSEGGTVVTFQTDVNQAAGRDFVAVAASYAFTGITGTASFDSGAVSGTAPQSATGSPGMDTNVESSVIIGIYTHGTITTYGSRAAAGGVTVRGFEQHDETLLSDSYELVLADALDYTADPGAIGITWSGYSGSATVRALAYVFEHAADAPPTVDGPQFRRPRKVRVGDLPFQLHTRMGDM